MLRHLRLVLVLLPALAAGCEPTTGPSDVSFEFTTTPPASAPEPLDLPAPGRIAVAGVLATPCSPYEARGDIVQRLDQVTVLVIGRPEGRCAPGAGRIYYSAGFELPPGEYTVRVIHHWDDAERPAETVLQRTVTVR